MSRARVVLLTTLAAAGLAAACADLGPGGGAPRPASMGAITASDIPSPIALDGDHRFRGEAAEAAVATLELDTEVAAGALEAAAAAHASSGAALAGVGEVRPMYGDGWQLFTLRGISENAEIWVANDLSYCYGDPADPRPEPVITDEQVEYMLGEMEDTIIPSNRTHFGELEDRDGTQGLFGAWGYDWYLSDNPQRVMALVFNIVDEGYCDPEYGFYVAGYYWADMNDNYADRNIIHIDAADWANRIGPSSSIPFLYEQVFTHELQHAIHHDHDADELAWVDEGMADLAPFLAGYGHSASHLAYYLVYHRTSLTNWGQNLEDYGASYLFQLYLLENFGGPAFVRALVDEQANGIEGIEAQLAADGVDADFDDIYRDWTLANYLDQPGLTGNSGGRLGYLALEIGSPDTWGYTIQWSIDNYYGSDHHGALPLPRYWGGYKSGTVEYPIGEVMPYAPLYGTYAGMQPELLSDFRGAATSGVAAYGGTYELWGDRGDLLTTVAEQAYPVTLGPGATLRFMTNYQIEELWDYAFVQITTDDGDTWTSLSNELTTTAHDPAAISTAVANLPGITGASGGWIPASFDLSAYEGQSVRVRFLYITDWGYNEAGFYVDDVVIEDGTGTLFADDLESGPDGWVLAGFQHTTGLATNSWALTFVNPVYTRGRFSHFEIVDAAPYASGAYQRSFDRLSTIDLRNDAVTIVLSNRLPEAYTSAASYRLLVQKGDAR